MLINTGHKMNSPRLALTRHWRSGLLGYFLKKKKKKASHVRQQASAFSITIITFIAKTATIYRQQ
jgi:hypothetical protein